MSAEIQEFLNNSEKRNGTKYLQKVFPTSKGVHTRVDTKTILSKISLAMNMTEEEYSFAPALDKTFGNAIIGRIKHKSYSNDKTSFHIVKILEF